MNNERYNQIIDEVYKKYVKSFFIGKLAENYEDNFDVYYSDIIMCQDFLGWPQDAPISLEEFINKIKTDNEFSERWGLKIEERELSLGERLRIVNYDKENFTSIDEWIGWYNNLPKEINYMGINYTKETTLDTFEVPTKFITLTYNNETIENYI
jgi:hypothetical protein